MNTLTDHDPSDLPVRDPRRAAARDVLSHFVRALKAVRLYPADNAVVQGSREDLICRLEQFLGEHGDLALSVTRGALHLDGETVHEDANSEMRLAFQLTIEGVREMVFHKGVAREEIAVLLRIFATLGMERDEADDLDTLLWQEDLQGISILILDEFYDDVCDEEEYLEFVEEGVADPQAHAVNATEQDELIEVLGDACSVPPSTGDEINVIGPEDRLRLEDLLIEQNKRDPMTTFGSILVDVLGVESDPLAHENLCGVLGRQLRVLAEQKELLRAARIAADAENLIQTLEDDARRQAIIDALATLPAKLIIEEMADAVAAADERGLDDLRRLLSRLVTRDPEAVVKLLERSDIRDLAIAALQDHLDRIIPLLAARVRDPRPDVVQVVARLLGETGNPRTLDLLGEIMRHADPRIRIAAIHAAATLNGGNALIEHALSDECENVRLAALRSRGLGDALLVRLKERVAAREIANTSFLEKREIFHALARNGGPEIVPFLARVLRRRALFRRERLDELRACAASALGVVGTSEALEILDGHLEDRSDRVREATFGALRDAGRRQ